MFTLSRLITLLFWYSRMHYLGYGYQRLLIYLKEKETGILKIENMEIEIILKRSNCGQFFKSLRSYYKTQEEWYVNTHWEQN